MAGDGVRRLRGQVTTKLADGAAFGVAVGPDGKVWVTVQDGVLVIDGETTKKLPTPTTPSTLVVTRRGPVFVDERLSISTLEGEAWKKDEEASRLLADAVEIRGVVGAASPKGKVPLLTAEAVALIGPDGEVHRQALDLPRDLSDVTAVALDGSDRLWISATFGLFIFGPDGKLLQQWPRGALPTSAKEILIHGEGPALPKAPPPAIRRGERHVEMLLGLRAGRGARPRAGGAPVVERPRLT